MTGTIYYELACKLVYPTALIKRKQLIDKKLKKEFTMAFYR